MGLGFRAYSLDFCWQAEPLAGGQMVGSGRLWVAPSAELDPRAVKVTMSSVKGMGFRV